MSEVTVVRQPSREWLENKGVFNWPTWEKEACSFPWFYDSDESCYLVSGEALLTAGGDDEVQVSAGDFITFPKGTACFWEVLKPVRKHYQLG